MSTATELKEQGNERFRAGDYKGAEKYYSLAIQKNSSNDKFFTNRAFTRVKLQAWEGCMDDCIKAIDLNQSSLKAYFYLAQAQLGLHRPNEALSSAMRAYELSLAQHDSSMGNVVQIVLEAKKQKWESRERDRIRRQNAMLRELSEGLETIRATHIAETHRRHALGELSPLETSEELTEIDEITRQKIEELEHVFAIASPDLEKREVPDWMIDDISFQVMLDPVITKTGHSYERATLLEHLRRSHTDPLTREPLTEAELRPNLALRSACEEFLEKNGWAVDY
ncbi:MAG: hypothetical protein M1834_006712 [Cirrosporium novae-zelandiae]|nr:MAG: hypothetical protein M1834_006712 [Cirrosporium novae-zelandiae]